MELGIKNDIILWSTFSEHQLFYLAGKASDKINDFGKALECFEKAVEVMETQEKVDLDYKEAKLHLVKMRCGFSLIHSRVEEKIE